MLQLLLNDLVFSLAFHNHEFLHKNTESTFCNVSEFKEFCLFEATMHNMFLMLVRGYSQNFGIALLQWSAAIFLTNIAKYYNAL